MDDSTMYVYTFEDNIIDSMHETYPHWSDIFLETPVLIACIITVLILLIIGLVLFDKDKKQVTYPTQEDHKKKRPYAIAGTIVLIINFIIIATSIVGATTAYTYHNDERNEYMKSRMKEADTALTQYRYDLGLPDDFCNKEDNKNNRFCGGYESGSLDYLNERGDSGTITVDLVTDGDQESTRGSIKDEKPENNNVTTIKITNNVRK